MVEEQRSVGIIGCGAIGAVVAEALAAGRVAGATGAGVATRTPIDTPLGPSVSVAELIERSDLVVECAGHAAVHDYAVQILESGTDLLVTSVGVLADQQLFDRVCTAGPGRLLISTGALGGLDLLRASVLAGSPVRVHLTTTKKPTVLVEDWMSEETVNELRAERRKLTVLEGSAREAAERFPRSANVAAALALAAGGWERVTTTVIADPQVARTTHEIEFCGRTGNCRITVENNPDAVNPATSAVVPYAVLRAIADETTHAWRFR